MKKSIRITNNTMRTEGICIGIEDARWDDYDTGEANPGVEITMDGDSWIRWDALNASDRMEAKQVAARLRKVAAEIERAMKRQAKKKPMMMPE